MESIKYNKSSKWSFSLIKSATLHQSPLKHPKIFFQMMKIKQKSKPLPFFLRVPRKL